MAVVEGLEPLRFMTLLVGTVGVSSPSIMMVILSGGGQEAEVGVDDPLLGPTVEEDVTISGVFGLGDVDD